MEVLNRALETTNVENATLQGALNQERNENQSLQTTVSTLKEDIAAKAGTIAKLNTELKDLKQRMEESVLYSRQCIIYIESPSELILMSLIRLLW